MPDELQSKYQIYHVLGKGGFGLVFLAKEKKDDSQKVVIKYHYKVEVDGKNNLQDMITERKCLYRLNNVEGVVNMVSNILGENSPYTVLQFFGESLQDYMTKKKKNNNNISNISNISEYKMIKNIMTQIIDVVLELYKRGIAHCDLKPSNILIEKEQIKLCDFGVSSISEKSGNKFMTRVTTRQICPLEVYNDKENGAAYVEAE